MSLTFANSIEKRVQDQCGIAAPTVFSVTCICSLAIIVVLNCYPLFLNCCFENISMDELTLLPGEEIIDQRGGDFGNGMTKTSGNCVITNQRLIVCSISKPKSGIKGAIAGVGAKLTFGDAAAMALHAVTFAQALKSKKPLYPVFEQPIDCLTQITSWRFGFAAGVNIATQTVNKFSLKLGTGKIRDQWIETLKQTIQQYAPQVNIADIENGIAFSCKVTAAEIAPQAVAKPPSLQPPPLQTQQPEAASKSSFVVQRGDKKSKPMTKKQLLSLIQQGKINPDDQVKEDINSGKIFSVKNLIKKYGQQ